MRLVPRTLAASAVAFAVLTFHASPSLAQLSGHNWTGDFGLQSGSQPAPGVYVLVPFFRYDTDTIRDRSGDTLNLPGDLGINMLAPAAFVVTDWKLFGANYGFMVAPSAVNTRYESPRFDQETGLSFSDTYVVPLNLGWHTPRADVTVAYGFFAPTGRYEAGGDDNRGLGMWSHEIAAGFTGFLDEEKSWHAATTMFLELHSEKEDSDVKVGNLVTLEGGVGRSFLQGAGSAGLAYYAQWKATADELEGLPGVLLTGKDRVYGLGPEVTMPFFASGPWAGLVTLRYQWELGARSTFEGQMFTVAVTLARIGWASKRRVVRSGRMRRITGADRVRRFMRGLGRRAEAIFGSGNAYGRHR